MRAIQYRQYGNPAQVLQLAEIANAPAPAGDEVQVRLLARPMHPGDLLGVQGRLRARGDRGGVASAGAVPGFEGMGIITAVGADVGGGLAPGMRVAVFPCQQAWAESINAPADFVTPVPDALDDALAAQLHILPLTALMLMRAIRAAGAGPDRALVLTAAGSSVARLVAQLALRDGITVIGLVRRADAVEDLQALLPGARYIATDDAAWPKMLAGALAGRSMQVLLDAVGGALASVLFEQLADGGAMICYGDLSGEPLSLPALAFPVRDVRVEGISVGRWPALPPAQRAGDLRQAMTLLLERPELLPVASRHDLADVDGALAAASRAGRTGAVLLTSMPAGALR